MNESFYSRKFDSIQMLRGIAALSVVLHHISFIENGAFGVDIFFCISGFIMMYVTNISTEKFLIKRFIRIIPLYYFITFLTFGVMLIFPYLFEKSSADAVILIKSLFFVPCSISGVIQPLVRVGWTLNYEIFFYIILWISILINKKYRGLIASGILVAIVVAGRLIPTDGVIMRFYSDTILIEFIFGMIAFEILRTICNDEGRKTKRNYIIVSLICYIFMFSVKYINVLSEVDRVLVYGIPAFVLFITAFIACYDVKIPKVFVFLGDISYSVYLVHYFIARYYDRFLMNHGYDNLLYRCAAILVFVCSIAIGSASYYLFEVRLNGFLRRKIC